MNTVIFLPTLLVFLVTLIGLYLFTVRREHCRMKFHICIAVSFVLQYIILYCMFNGDVLIQGVPLSKILTFVMMSLLIFWGGLYVYGGWARIGIYLFCVDLIIGVSERLCWAAWEYITHRPADRALIYFEGNAIIGWDAFFMYLLEYILRVPLLIGVYKLRSRPLRPEWLIKTVVIIYLIFGGSPLLMRTGFEDVSGGGSFFSELVSLLVLSVLLFLVFTTMNMTAARENKRFVYLRKQMVTEQSQLLMIQKEKLRRLRHDVKKHLSNLDYILEREPGLRSDPSFLRYRELLNTNEEWMKGKDYCASSVMNLCFEQMKRYCDSEGIALEIILKRLDFSAWTEEDQLMFGTLLLDLLEMSGNTRSISAVRYSGDNLMGQNILRIRMETKADENQNMEIMRNKTKDRKAKERKLISNLEKDIQLVLSKYGGRMERAEKADHLGYVMNWED